MLKNTAREAAAEFLGTFILITFGVASVAQAVLSGQKSGSTLSIHLSWGIAVTLAVYVAGGVSGGHLNPAVTLALAIFRGFPWRKVPAYFAAQFLGAFAGAALVFATYRDALFEFDGGNRTVLGPAGTAGIWATYPQNFLGTGAGFLDQTVGTALLVMCIFALSDRRNAAPGPNVAPVVVGAVVVLIGMSFGFNAGYAINPARDLGPRVFTALAGWGSEVFIVADHWWWVPVVAPCVGAVTGGWIYEGFIGRHHP